MDPTELNDACGAEPGSFCEWVFDLTDSVRATQFANWFTHNPLRIAVIILLAWVLNVVAGRAIRRLVERLVRERAAKAAPSGERGERIRNELWGERAERSRQRTLTMGAVLRSISSFAIFTVAALLCLGEFGIDLAPLLAGAGIAGWPSGSVRSRSCATSLRVCSSSSRTNTAWATPSIWAKPKVWSSR
jgi:moderate conductance mechanosensitive channel